MFNLIARAAGQGVEARDIRKRHLETTHQKFVFRPDTARNRAVAGTSVLSDPYASTNEMIQEAGRQDHVNITLAERGTDPFGQPDDLTEFGATRSAKNDMFVNALGLGRRELSEPVLDQRLESDGRIARCFHHAAAQMREAAMADHPHIGGGKA